MIEPITLRYFNEVATLGTVRQAAEKLFVAQSAVSRQIGLLEEELGVPLFERHARGMSLTNAGRLLLEYSNDNRVRLAELRGLIQEYETLQRGHASVASVEGMLANFMPNAVRDFSANYPGISLNISAMGSHAVAEAVAEHRYDLGIVFGNPPRPDLLELARMSQPLCAVVARRHPLAAQHDCTLAAAVAYPLILPDRSFGIRQLVDLISAKEKLTLHKIVETNTLYFARRLVMQGDIHVTFLPADAVSMEIEAGTLVAVPLQDPAMRNTHVVLIADASRKLPQAAQTLADHLAKTMHL